MVSIKLAPFKSSFKPLQSITKSKNTLRKQFKHVACTDDEASHYFKDAAAAHAAMAELGQRSWEYQYEFAAEMFKRCHEAMGKNPDMVEALDVYEEWLDEHREPEGRRFALLRDTIFLANLYPRAQRLVVSEEALQFALSYTHASSHKKAFHHVAVDKSNEFGQDLLSQRQRALEKIVPLNTRNTQLYEWERDREGNITKVPSRLHLEWLCWGYTPDERGVWECGMKDLGDRLSGVL